MHVVIDTVGVRGGSVAVLLTNLLNGWSELGVGDRITVVTDGEFPVPDGMSTERISSVLPGALGSLWRHSFGIRAAARRLRADLVVSGLPARCLLGTGCPRVAIVYDLRHELRPQQFSRARRTARALSYGWTYRRATYLACISQRTVGDLVAAHPHTASKTVLTPMGADHADGWPDPEPAADPPYALAFGHFANKNASAVIAGWAELCRRNEQWLLRLVGLGEADRASAAAEVQRLGISDRVELMRWLDDPTFVRTFAGAGLIIFPSDFEGFGLPAVEALRRRIPLVISADPALLEVSGGHAEVVADLSPAAVAEAMERAIATDARRLQDGFEWAGRFTWRRMAEAIRAAATG